ncbi:MAG: type II toxin-antitoxin system RelE/ParE family toxin [Caulobacter sp.]
MVFARAVAGDLERLAGALAGGRQETSERIAGAVKAGVRSLQTFALRGLPGPDDLRELTIRFERDAYVIHCRVESERVVILRLFQAQEA